MENNEEFFFLTLSIEKCKLLTMYICKEDVEQEKRYVCYIKCYEIVYIGKGIRIVRVTYVFIH